MNILDHMEGDDHLHLSTDNKDYLLAVMKKESDNEDEGLVNISFNKVIVKYKIDTIVHRSQIS